MTHEAHDLPGGLLLRLVASDDAGRLLAAYRRNRAHLEHWDPRRSERFYTLEGQRARLADQLAQWRAGRARPYVLADGDRVVGTATLSGIVMGPFCSADLGYWIDADYLGRGLATATVELLCRDALTELGLHRVEASTLVDNVRSQRVLAKCGFERYGLAPRYLHIDGRWQDQILFQRILHDEDPKL
jgi:[ribosomal protein S5]-alanine N-acetyltransferase